MEMAKVQFNCRLDESFIKWIDAEAVRQSKKLKRKFSQADVVMMLIGSAIHSDRALKAEKSVIDWRAEHTATLDAVGPKASDGRGKASVETFHRGPRQKGDRNR